MWYNLMTDEEREDTEFVINLSYGKDSLAAIHVAVDILKIPIWLIRIVHAEVWATDTIPADLPPMVEFKRWADGFIKGRWGLTVEHVCATRGGWKDTYSRQFYDCFGSGKNEGRRKGFPFQKGSWCKRLKYGHEVDLRGYLLSHPAEGIGGASDLRLSDGQGELVHQQPQGGSSQQIMGFATKWSQYCTGELKKPVFSDGPRRRGAKKNIVHLLGIAADEPERIARYIDKPGYLLPLVEAGWDEDLCGLWCQYEGLLSPVYENACRSGCWFCHNQGVEQLRLLRRNYPNLWALLLKWDLDSPVTFHADGHTVHDFDRRFALEDERKIPTDKRFRWKMLDDPPKFVAYEGEQISMRI